VVCRLARCRSLRRCQPCIWEWCRCFLDELLSKMMIPTALALLISCCMCPMFGTARACQLCAVWQDQYLCCMHHPACQVQGAASAALHMDRQKICFNATFIIYHLTSHPLDAVSGVGVLQVKACSLFQAVHCTFVYFSSMASVRFLHSLAVFEMPCCNIIGSWAACAHAVALFWLPSAYFRCLGEVNRSSTSMQVSKYKAESPCPEM
jgi:hypothetical protein